MRILVVEDEPTLAAQLAAALGDDVALVGEAGVVEVLEVVAVPANVEGVEVVGGDG